MGNPAAINVKVVDILKAKDLCWDAAETTGPSFISDNSATSFLDLYCASFYQY